MSASTKSLPQSVRIDDGHDPLISVRTVASRGLGHPHTIRRYIHEGRLPAVKVGKQFMVRESDLALLARPVNPKPSEQSFELDALVEALVDTFPALGEDRKRELGQLLAPSAA